MSHKTREFVADRQNFIRGFWRPNKGDVIEGVIVELVENEFKSSGGYLILRLTKSCDVTARDRDTGEEFARKAKEEQNVGVSFYAGFRGLERHPGKWVKITCLGKKKEKGEKDEMITRWDFKIDLSEDVVDPLLAKPIVPSARNGARSARGAAGSRDMGPTPKDDDIPF